MISPAELQRAAQSEMWVLLSHVGTQQLWGTGDAFASWCSQPCSVPLWCSAWDLSLRDQKSQCMNEARSCAINITRVIPSALLRIFQVRQKGLRVLCAVSPKAAKSLDTPKLPQASLIQSFTRRRRVWEHVSLPNFHSPWVLSSATQIDLSEQNLRNALK